MNVHLTFDVEVWCGGWDGLDERFPASFERYVYGRSSAGDYALPATLEILARHGLQAVFFVEPLFSARFGVEFLSTIVTMIQSHGQRVQLHLHPEWSDEIRPPPIEGCERKRQYLSMYPVEQQAELIRLGCELLRQAGVSSPVTAFRAGSYAADAATFEALGRNGIYVDSSLNECFPVSGTDVSPRSAWAGASRYRVGSVTCYPVTAMRDGFGRLRPAQVGACSFAELRDAMISAQRAGRAEFVIVSHNFEMLAPGSRDPDRIVVRRFEGLCKFLAGERGRFSTTSDMSALGEDASPGTPARRPQTSVPATVVRHVEQALRRLA